MPNNKHLIFWVYKETINKILCDFFLQMDFFLEYNNW